MNQKKLVKDSSWIGTKHIKKIKCPGKLKQEKVLIMSLSSKKPFTLNLQVFIDRLSLQSL